MKRILLTLCVSMFTVTNIMFGGIGATIIDYIPIPGTSMIAFNVVYKEAMGKIYELRDQKREYDYRAKGEIVKHVVYSSPEKKYAVDRIIKLSYDMIDIFTSVTERFSDKVKALREYTKQEADKMKTLEPDAIKNNDFIAIADIAERLIDYLASKASQTDSVFTGEMRADLDTAMKKEKESSRKELESRK